VTAYTTDCPAAFALALDKVLDEIELAGRARAFVAAMFADEPSDDGTPAPVVLSPYNDDSETDDGLTAELTAFCRTVAEMRGRTLLEAAP
jgi:hypothetical protein